MSSDLGEGKEEGQMTHKCDLYTGVMVVPFIVKGLMVKEVH